MGPYLRLNESTQPTGQHLPVGCREHLAGQDPGQNLCGATFQAPFPVPDDVAVGPTGRNPKGPVPAIHAVDCFHGVTSVILCGIGRRIGYLRWSRPQRTGGPGNRVRAAASRRRPRRCRRPHYGRSPGKIRKLPSSVPPVTRIVRVSYSPARVCCMRRIASGMGSGGPPLKLILCLRGYSQAIRPVALKASMSACSSVLSTISSRGAKLPVPRGLSPSPLVRKASQLPVPWP